MKTTLKIEVKIPVEMSDITAAVRQLADNSVYYEDWILPHLALELFGKSWMPEDNDLQPEEIQLAYRQIQLAIQGVEQQLYQLQEKRNAGPKVS